MNRLVVALMLLAGCGPEKLPGQPTGPVEAGDPREVVAFEPLYAQNCAGCHGAKGGGGAAIGLASPDYLAFAGDGAIRDVIANGRPSSAMPAFAKSAGGMLTDAQVDALVAGMRAWGTAAQSDATLPPYAPAAAGDPARGEKVFQTHCASCHGAGGKGGAIVDGAFLALVSDQYLRTIIVVGRPDLGSPNYRAAGGSPMTSDEVTDTVAWMAAQREAFPGQPYPNEEPIEAKKGSQP